MTCYSPLRAWYSHEIGASGKRQITFNPSRAYERDAPINVPCGQCVGCRLEKSRQWAMRCYHESQLYENNCFLTLTFDDKHLMERPNPLSLDVRDFQLFMKKYRKKYGSGIRFFHCGEYGNINLRPHYHAIIFNHDFADRTLFKITNGHRLYISAELSKLWPYGYCTIGNVTFESAAYVARYIMKKVTGDAKEDHYKTVNPVTGEILPRKPEYVTMSRRPGIGKGWYEKYGKYTYDHDHVVINGKTVRPPKYYDNLYQNDSPVDWDYIKDQRATKALDYSCNNTPDRLRVREAVLQKKLDRLPRNLE